MGKRVVLRKRSRKPCVGEMRDWVLISNRRLTAPKFGAVDFDEAFRNAVGRWASVRTVTGKTVFSGAGVDEAVTHEVWIRYDPSVGSESWVVLQDGTRLEVVAFEDPEQRREFLLLNCVVKGDKDVEASKA